ncbi:hypothetical protein RvY_13329 [Ramazzottius varieornatus]|uniref:G-protein coupled receptors family 1 profile domain-containing protein n=1 Tax=Ramazzottius varieornatus TaxID=947166 RepID=A0A1D1VW21_RAMVA|nr:hypothetical protein RvY_13329 [Ramazzottius varieornatus]
MNDTIGGFSVSNLTIPIDACASPSFAFTSPQRLAVYILAIPQTILTIIMNILVLLTFVFNKNLRTAQHFNFLNLALCDFIIACVALPSRLTLDLHGCWPAPYAFCRLYKLLDWITTSEAAFTVILIAVTRYRMITRGAVYNQEETSRKVINRIILTWIINILLYGPVQFVDKYTRISITGVGQCSTEFFQISWLGNLLVFTNNILPPVIVVVIYAFVFHALRGRTNQIAANPSNAQSAANSTRPKENRAAKQGRALMLLTASFLLTSCPVGIISIVMFANDSLTIFQVYLFLLYLLYFNSLMNTLVYTSKVPAMKTGMQKLLCMRPGTAMDRMARGTITAVETKNENS